MKSKASLVFGELKSSLQIEVETLSFGKILWYTEVKRLLTQTYPEYHFQQATILSAPEVTSSPQQRRPGSL